MQRAILLTALIGIGLLATPAARSDEPVTLILKDRRFTPSTVIVPAGQRFRIELTNRNTTVAEFESYDMKFEKIVVPGGKVFVFAGPLRPGSYRFFDDYSPETSDGTVTAVAGKD